MTDLCFGRAAAQLGRQTRAMLVGLGLVSLLPLTGCGGASFAGSGEDGGAAGAGAGKGGNNSSGGGRIGGSSSTGGQSAGAGGADGCPADVACAAIGCGPGFHSVLRPGECCPSCDPDPMPPSCKGVECSPPQCRPGYAPGPIPGACCHGCVENGDPIEPINCTAVDCTDATKCPLGYHPEVSQGSCCAICVPDPGYCQVDSDCLIADRPRACCGCPEAISERHYQNDVCWSDAAAPRPLPEHCTPQVFCAAICAPCAAPGEARCVERHCTEVR